MTAVYRCAKCGHVLLNGESTDICKCCQEFYPWQCETIREEPTKAEIEQLVNELERRD